MTTALESAPVTFLVPALLSTGFARRVTASPVPYSDYDGLDSL